VSSLPIYLTIDEWRAYSLQFCCNL